jgi:hypothetical protein
MDEALRNVPRLIAVPQSDFDPLQVDIIDSCTTPIVSARNTDHALEFLICSFKGAFGMRACEGIFPPTNRTHATFKRSYTGVTHLAKHITAFESSMVAATLRVHWGQVPGLLLEGDVVVDQASGIQAS